jgi:hypothetical protein
MAAPSDGQYFLNRLNCVPEPDLSLEQAAGE